MHSFDSARKRVRRLLQGKEAFLKLPRDLAKKAQERESITTQPKEKLEGMKAKITITNYLGGKYFFISDEVEIHGNRIHLICARATSGDITRSPANSPFSFFSYCTHKTYFILFRYLMDIEVITWRPSENTIWNLFKFILMAP